MLTKVSEPAPGMNDVCRTSSETVASVTKVDRATAREALNDAGNNVEEAIQSLMAQRVIGTTAADEPMAMLLRTSSEVRSSSSRCHILTWAAWR